MQLRDLINRNNAKGWATRLSTELLNAERTSQTLRPFETHEGAATRKSKTVPKGGPPARGSKNRLKGWATRPIIVYKQLLHPTSSVPTFCLSASVSY
jgi:hypothetical protein